MARLKDRKTGEIVEIEMKTWQEDQNQYTEDWSNDFFEVGCLEHDEEDDTLYLVDDVEYCIEQANDWKMSKGDFNEAEYNENNTVFVTRSEK